MTEVNNDSHKTIEEEEIDNENLSTEEKRIERFKTPRKKPISNSKRSGLLFPVGATKTYMNKNFNGNVSMQSAVYLTAIMEYLATELIDVSYQDCLNNNRKRIIPRNIFLAIQKDQDLKDMFKGSIIIKSGVVPEND